MKVRQKERAKEIWSKGRKDIGSEKERKGGTREKKSNESLGLCTTRGSSNLHLKRPTTCSNIYHNSLNITVLLTGITFQIISRLFAQ